MKHLKNAHTNSTSIYLGSGELWADGAFLGTKKSVKIGYVHEENIIASAHTLEFQRKRGVTGSPILEFQKES